MEFEELIPANTVGDRRRIRRTPTCVLRALQAECTGNFTVRRKHDVNQISSRHAGAERKHHRSLRTFVGPEISTTIVKISHCRRQPSALKFMRVRGGPQQNERETTRAEQCAQL
jgi:hypothetical protein